MKYFLDTEFLEGTQKTWFGQTEPTIDLISIGIVCEDGREYYAISKDFNLKEAWNRYDIKTMTNLKGDSDTNKMKVYWLRDNVLKPIFKELFKKENSDYMIQMFYPSNKTLEELKRAYFYEKFTYRNFKRLIKKYGKSNKQIAEEIYEFCSNDYHKGNNLTFNQRKEYSLYNKFKPEFYGYYSDYDWVVFCWLFGKMIDLPQGFPMYCIDLKQILDEMPNRPKHTIFGYRTVEDIKSDVDYPKQTNEHNALSDARWNHQLYKFLNTL